MEGHTNILPDFGSIKQINILGREYWSARDLMKAPGYEYWQNFEKVIHKAMTAATSPEINLRLKVADENVQLSSTALQSGVQSANMGLFHDAGYQGMYTMTSGELATFWNLPAGTEILDVMGSEALGANLFRVTQTDAKLKRDQVTEEDTAILTHHDVGLEVRRAIENIHQRKPEDLLRAASIRRLVEEKRRKTHKKLKESLPEEQGKLF